MIEIIRIYSNEDDSQVWQDLANFLVNLVLNLPETPDQDD